MSPDGHHHPFPIVESRALVLKRNGWAPCKILPQTFTKPAHDPGVSWSPSYKTLLLSCVTLNRRRKLVKRRLGGHCLFGVILYLQNERWVLSFDLKVKTRICTTKQTNTKLSLSALMSYIHWRGRSWSACYRDKPSSQCRQPASQDLLWGRKFPTGLEQFVRCKRLSLSGSCLLNPTVRK